MRKTAKRSGVGAIFKKELSRFFTDRRAVITTIFLPGLLIFTIYSFLGAGLMNIFSVDASYVPSIAVLNAPPSAQTLAQAAGLTLTTISADEVDATRDAVANKDVDLLVIFPADFDNLINDRLTEQTASDEASSGQVTTEEDIPAVQLFYNSTRTQSSSAYGVFSSLLAQYRDTRFTLFTINPSADPGVVYDLATKQDVSGLLFSSLLPMVMILFIFSGCMAVTPESIAGEKERGTIATLLVTPLKRHELAIGKMLALGCVSFLAAASSFIGVVVSVPRLVARTGGMADVSLYGLSDYLLLLVVLISTMLLFVGLLSVLSAFAKTVKEASTMAMPLMIVVILVAVLGSFSGQSNNLLSYLIPSFNSAQSIAGIFSFNAQPLFILVTVVVNLVLSGLCAFALTRMFNSERIVFTK